MSESSDAVLVAVETAGIQSYIFGSNQLRENVGASYLVAAATEDWVRELIYTSELAHNLDSDLNFLSKTLDQHGIDVEILYCGGGNAVLLFREDSHAREFVSSLSRRVLIDAPGLQLVFHRQSVNLNEGEYTEIVDQFLGLSHSVSALLTELKSQRSKQPLQGGVAGLGVTAMCASTSLPAVTMARNPDGKWQAISAQSHAKRKAVDSANQKLDALLTEVQEQVNIEREKYFDIDKHQIPTDLTNYRFALELDDLGRTKGESSFIAVVHADGNDMGRLIQGLKTDYPTPKHNRKYIDTMRNFSEKIKHAAQSALVEMLVLLTLSIREKDGESFIHGMYNQADIKLKRHERDNRFILPFRPLVSGGDDITFVCDGRIGIDMAVRFAEAFEKKTEELLKQRLTACAGVAIVNAHYPFARAYELAEELCQSAKQERYSSQQQNSSLVDWHYTTGGLYDDLAGMRKREYQVGLDNGDIGHLHLRPLFIDDNAHEYRTWTQVRRIATQFQKDWSDHRSKAKGLMDALRGGPAASTAFRLRYIDKNGLSLPQLYGAQPEVTWLEGRCLYYDALELMDLYIPLTEGVHHVSQD